MNMPRLPWFAAAGGLLAAIPAAPIHQSRTSFIGTTPCGDGCPRLRRRDARWRDVSCDQVGAHTGRVGRRESLASDSRVRRAAGDESGCDDRWGQSDEAGHGHQFDRAATWRRINTVSIDWRRGIVDCVRSGRQRPRESCARRRSARAGNVWMELYADASRSRRAARCRDRASVGRVVPRFAKGDGIGGLRHFRTAFAVRGPGPRVDIDRRGWLRSPQVARDAAQGSAHESAVVLFLNQLRQPLPGTADFRYTLTRSDH